MKLRLLLPWALPLLFAADQARADPLADARHAAAIHFDRASRLVDEGDNAGALVEYKQANELVPDHPLVLYNIGLVAALAGKPVEAVPALERALLHPEPLTPEQRLRAQRTLDEERLRVGQLFVESNVAGALVEVDGVEGAHTPVASAMPVSGGAHVLTILAEGYAPLRREVVIPGGGSKRESFSLVILQARVGQIRVRSRLRGTDVFVDNERAGTTPLVASISVAPGAHHVELRRRGYHAAAGDVTIGDGSLADLDLSPVEDPDEIRSLGSSLLVSSTESEPLITVDDVRYGVADRAVLVAPGLHRVRLERGGFEPIERDVDAMEGTVTPVRAIFEPTPEARAAYVDSARRQRVWSMVTIAAGALIAGGGAVLAWRSNLDAQSANANLVAADPNRIGGPCDGRKGLNTPACQAEEMSAANDLGAANTRQTVGYVGIGVGSAITVAGVVLLAVSDNPKRYDRKLPDNPFASIDARPILSVSRDGVVCGIRATF